MNRVFAFKNFKKQIDFYCNDNFLIIIEDFSLFYTTLFRIKNEDFSTFIDIISDDKKDSIDQYVDVVQDLFLLNINSKKNTNAIYKQIKKIYKNELNDTGREISKLCDKTFKIIYLDYSIELCSDIEVNEDDILDLIRIRIKESDNGFIENIIIYIKTAIELRNIRIFIFNGLCSYLDNDNITKLLSECKYLNIIIIDLEAKNPNDCLFDNKFIIDKDFCNIE